MLNSKIIGALSAPTKTWSFSQKQSFGYWSDLSVSSDCSKMLLTQGSSTGGIYISSDFGDTWTTKYTGRYWGSVCGSSDHSMLLVNEDLANKLFKSIDYGNTWTQIDSGRLWVGLDCSRDGTYVYGSANNILYTSSDSGATWTSRLTSTNANWIIRCSGDGRVAIAFEGYFNGSNNLYITTDYGNTWTPRGPSKDWVSVGCNNSGSKMLAYENSVSLYESTDSGTTWNLKTSGTPVYDMDISASGGEVIAGALNSVEGISRDFGSTWTNFTDLYSANVTRMLISDNADKVVIAYYGGPLYLGTYA